MRIPLWSGVGVAMLHAAACTTFGTELAIAPDAGDASPSDARATDDGLPRDASVADAAPSADDAAGRAPCAGEAACEHYMFVTSELYRGVEIGGAIGADRLCTKLASLTGALPELQGRTWQAWISDEKFSASARLTHATRPYRLVSQALVANDWTQLASGGLDSAIDLTERGLKVGEELVWTGTTPAGEMLNKNTCASWSTNGAGSAGSVGSALAVNGTWTSTGETLPCVQAHRLYCIEK